MTNPEPLVYGHVYHLYSRGNGGKRLFFGERNYRYFLERYTYYIMPIAETFAYCLLPNHFHFLIRLKEREEIDSMLVKKPPSRHVANLLNAYARALNKATQQKGALFQRPFGRKLVEDDAYFARLVVYIHQNPQRHGLVDDFRTWIYSSYPAMVSKSRTRLERETVIDLFGGRRSLVEVHREEMEALMEDEDGEDLSGFKNLTGLIRRWAIPG